MPTLPLQIVGALCVALALAHAAFPRHFRWREDLARVPLFTRQVFWVHTMFIALVLLEQGLLLLLRPDLLLASSPLAAAVTGGLAVFWALRLYAQWGIFDRALWQGRRLETCMHWTFTCTWTFFTSVYAWAWWCQVTVA